MGTPILLNEGSIGLPSGFEDRTSNIFVPANTETEPNLSIARDTLNEGETLGDYVSRQTGLLKSRLAGHKVVLRTTASLGSADAALSGERIDAQYKNGGRIIHQRQAAFLIAPRRALVFSASCLRPFDDAFEDLWRDWLASFERHSAPESND